MFWCAIKLQESGTTLYVQENEIITFGRKQSYVQFDPKNVGDFKPRAEYGIIVQDNIKRCLILGMAATEESVRELPLKSIKVHSKRPASESLQGWTCNSKKVKLNDQKKSHEASDRDIANELEKNDKSSATNKTLAKIGKDLVRESMGESLMSDGEETIDGKGEKSPPVMAPAESAVVGSIVNVVQRPKSPLIKEKSLLSDDSEDYDDIFHSKGKETTENSPFVTNITDNFCTVESQVASCSNAQQSGSTSSDSHKTSAPAQSKSNQSRNEGQIFSRSGDFPRKSAPVHSKRNQTENEVSGKVGSKNNNFEDKKGNSHLDLEGFELTGDNEKDSERIMNIFQHAVQVIVSIDERTKAIQDEISGIKALITESQQQPSVAATTICHPILEDKTDLPGYVSFGSNFHAPIKKVNEYTENNENLQTKVNNLTLLVLKDDVVNYALRVPKENPQNLKRFPPSIIETMTEVINKGNREVAFNEIVKKERQELHKIKSAQEISLRLEELRKISDAQCVDLVKQDICEKLSHSIYNAKKLLQKKKEADTAKEAAEKADTDDASVKDGDDQKQD